MARSSSADSKASNHSQKANVEKKVKKQPRKEFYNRTGLRTQKTRVDKYLNNYNINENVTLALTELKKIKSTFDDAERARCEKKNKKFDKKNVTYSINLKKVSSATRSVVSLAEDLLKSDHASYEAQKAKAIEKGTKVAERTTYSSFKEVPEDMLLLMVISYVSKLKYRFNPHTSVVITTVIDRMLSQILTSAIHCATEKGKVTIGFDHIFRFNNRIRDCELYPLFSAMPIYSDTERKFEPLIESVRHGCLEETRGIATRNRNDIKNEFEKTSKYSFEHCVRAIFNDIAHVDGRKGMISSDFVKFCSTLVEQFLRTMSTQLLNIIQLENKKTIRPEVALIAVRNLLLFHNVSTSGLDREVKKVLKRFSTKKSEKNTSGESKTEKKSKKDKKEKKDKKKKKTKKDKVPEPEPEPADSESDDEVTKALERQLNDGDSTDPEDLRV